MKRILTVLITLVFAILSWSTFAFAGSNDIYGRNAGTCGDSVKWKMDDDGNMTIHGTGPMKDYCSGDCPSYCGFAKDFYIGPHVKTVTFEDGVTSVGTYALTTNGLGGKTTSNVESVTICSSITSIGESAFNRNSVKDIYIYSENVTFGNNAIYSGTTIFGYSGSTAETYAKKNGNTFVAMCQTHTENIKNAKEATCTENGYTGEKVCSVCGAVTEYGHTTAALGHDYQLMNQKDATCTEPGYSGDFICSRCKAVESEGTVIDKLNHKWGDWNLLKSPTCEKVGAKIRFCNRCNAEEIEKVSKLDHEWETESRIDKEPTCTEKGSKSIHCANCSATKDLVEIDATGHKYTHVIQKAQIGKAGREYDKCTTCGSQKNEKTIKALMPQKTTLKKLKAGKKAFTVSWTKKAYSGYQIRYSLKSSMKSATYKNVSASKTSLKVKKLKTRKKYYVQIRTYKTVDGKKCYSTWSSAKKVKTK